MNELITVKQLPIIEERLKELSEEIDLKVNNALSLVCNNETVKEIKKTKAELNNEFKELETQRKIVKEQVLKPYNEFEDIYKMYVADKFENADATLKNKIDSVESEIKKSISDKLESYFSEYREHKGIDETYIVFEDLGINVGLGYATEKGELTKKAKEEVSKYLDHYADTLSIIETMQYGDEILVEFIKCRDLAIATKEVNERHRVLEQVKEQKVAKEEQVLTDEEMLKKIDALSAPKVVEQPKLCGASFRVVTSYEKLSLLVNFMREKDIEFKQLNGGNNE